MLSNKTADFISRPLKYSTTGVVMCERAFLCSKIAINVTAFWAGATGHCVRM